VNQDIIRSLLMGIYLIGVWILFGILLSIAFKKYRRKSPFWQEPQARLLFVCLAAPRLFLTLSLPLNGNEMGGDAILYHQLARSMFPAQLYLATGYPFLAGFFLRMMANLNVVSPYFLVVVQHTVGIIMGLMLYETLREYLPSFTFATALLWGVSAPTLFAEHLSRPEFLTAFFLFALLFLMMRFMKIPAASYAWLLGVAMGWGALVRANFLSVLPIVVGFLLWRPASRWASKIKDLGRFLAGFMIIYAGYMVCVHYPTSRTWVYNWTMAMNVRTNIADDVVMRSTDAYKDYATMHDQVGRFLKEKIKTKDDLQKWIFPADRMSSLQPESLQDLRKEFERFRETPGNRKNLSVLPAPKDLIKAYPFESNYLYIEGANAVYGLDRNYKLLMKLDRSAIQAHPFLYLRSMAKGWLNMFGIGGRWRYEFCPPPPQDLVIVSRTFLHSFHWGYRMGYDESAIGIYWSVGEWIFQKWSTLESYVLPFVFAAGFLYTLGAGVLGFVQRKSCPMPFLCQLSLALLIFYSLGIVTFIYGQPRYSLPVHVLGFILTGTPKS